MPEPTRVPRSLRLCDRCPQDGEVTVRHAWNVRADGSLASWFDVRLVFADGASVEALAVVSPEGVGLEDVRARPALGLDDLALLGEWLEDPLAEACGAARADGAPAAVRHARPAVRPSGAETPPMVAREYRTAQERGADPVLAVMRATGESRRGALRLIGRARDAGLLTPRHLRR
ncbi:hypothetical protein GCM10010259_45240 [Streptomyces daghestanicus]|uniref:Uncharacterized protein n=2 Tax=Streptomyces TaxID=1883 RepID=A0ABT9LA74_STRGD|nr:hypothetical protein [Streptomyces griseoviridis]GGT13255.1 hypothetical protein GCM10010240_53220 [Streptomyces griseoviridis]GGU48937.1 hypothetical protein GCM10010259_45240 [Streptomyces daghestanicus]GHI29304.1 hypothetical protein Sdagh_10340 [Streptomyces daghestanicus]